MENYTYGLKIQGRTVKFGDKIKITKTDGNSNMSYLFSKKVVDEAIIEFIKHHKYNTLMLTVTLKSNSRIITVAERHSLSKEELDDINKPEKYNAPFIEEPIEMNIAFADELELSDAKFIENNTSINNNDIKPKTEVDFFEAMEKWEKSFYCNECGCDEIKDFSYDRTVSNGEVWICRNCKTETVVDNKPNEDTY